MFSLLLLLSVQHFIATHQSRKASGQQEEKDTEKKKKRAHWSAQDAIDGCCLINIGQNIPHSIYGWSFHVILTSHSLVGLQQWLAAGIRAHHHL
jgi:hypothetical protein